MSIDSRSRQYGVVFDHWQIKEFLGSGSGGKSAVFSLGRMDSAWGKSALKVINLIEEKGNIDALSDYRRIEYEQVKNECKQSAEQEVRLMDQMHGNTNIVDYLDHKYVNWSDETGFGCDMLIRMELLEDLRGKLRQGHLFPEEEVLKVGRDICTALVLCHRKGILHRDIKPENIFINSDGNYKLGDFGVSRILSNAPTAVASTGIGTPEYAAPEQFSGQHDKRVDIYSLGLVLYELSNANKLPFASTSYTKPMDIARRQCGEALPIPSNASRELAEVILKACAYDPENRYRTAEEFLEALDELAKATRHPEATASHSGNETPPAQPTPPESNKTVPLQPIPVPGSREVFAKSAPPESNKTVPLQPIPVPDSREVFAKSAPLQSNMTVPVQPIPVPGSREVFAKSAPLQSNMTVPAQPTPLPGSSKVSAQPKPGTPAPQAKQNRKPYALIGGILAVVAVGLVLVFMLLSGKDTGNSGTQSNGSGNAGSNAHTHTWQSATCTAPKTCRTCGETVGNALGHDWSAATCTTPKTCRTCGKTSGDTVGHNWISATCTAPKTCRTCGKTEGKPSGHDWMAATTSAPKTCRDCGAKEGSPLPDISVGDVITMGRYGNESIKWIVLEYNPSTQQALLISQYCLDAVPFHSGSGKATWENSSIRKWLNNAFINAAFTQKESASILTKTISASQNPDYGTDSGSDTRDRVFLLSYEEAIYYFPSQTSRQGTPTPYCKAQGCYDPVKYAQENGTTYAPEEAGHTWWWLRTAGSDGNRICNVVAKGTASTYGAFKTSNEGAVRPAMWVQLG